MFAGWLSRGRRGAVELEQGKEKGCCKRSREYMKDVERMAVTGDYIYE